MQLNRVTITGADDSVEPADLLALSRQFPFVEWGILISKNSMGTRRFPTGDWLWKFRDMVRRFPPVQASMHVCGRWVRQMLKGETPQEIWTFLDEYQRMQLNFHAEGIEWDIAEFRQVLEAFSNEGQRQFIFQLDGNRGEQLWREVVSDQQFDVDCKTLFDMSHGAGVCPKEWPQAFTREYHGYAGGLGPDNLAEQIPLIGEAAGDCKVWIDMETKVRSKDDKQFDLAKVRRCLEIAEPFIQA